MAAIDPNWLEKFLAAVKELPPWLLTALSVAAGLMLFVPAINAELPKEYRPWLVAGFVLFGTLTAFKWLDLLAGKVQAARIASKNRKTFHVTVVDAEQAFWHLAIQPDKSIVTQISVRLLVKNQGTTALGLTGVRLVRPSIKGPVVSSSITVREQHGRMHGTAQHSDHRIAPGTALPAHGHLMIRGTPSIEEDRPLTVVLGILNEDGHEERVRVVCNATPKPRTGTPKRQMESLHLIENPIEKDVAAVLQAESARYEKNGRQAGGLGSILISYGGRTLNQIGTDSWTPNSPVNQEIVSDPNSTSIVSDHLDALLTLYGRLATSDEHEGFAHALLDRLADARGYQRVAYFIVCVLWKIGRLDEGLDAARKGLPAHDDENQGLNNVLLMLNGFLRYLHSQFGAAELDSIERFVSESAQHPTRIPAKIAAVRAFRLRQAPEAGTVKAAS